MGPSTVVGIDLAWGMRARTGVCVAEDGRVVASSTVVDDDAIVAQVPSGPCVLAIDAPIVVRNATGRRTCDAEVSRCFGPYHAGAYPANRSIPWLREPRAGRLADRLGAVLTPGSARRPDRRVALEVYPHAAMVVLFGLERILPYKRGRGRTLAVRRAAFERLCAGLEQLADAEVPLDVSTGPRWPALRAAVAGATIQADLNRCEDELDAHVCAYVGLLHARGSRGRTCVVGDPDGGQLVVPVTATIARCLGGR